MISLYFSRWRNKEWYKTICGSQKYIPYGISLQCHIEKLGLKTGKEYSVGDTENKNVKPTQG